MTTIELSNEFRAEHDPFAGPAILRTAPSSESQREIWSSALESDAASLAFNESVGLRFRGRLDLAILREALRRLTERHESMRMTLSADGMQVFVSEAPAAFNLELEEGVSLSQAMQEEVNTPFDLVRGPLFRARLLKTGTDEHVLLLCAHHIVCDGWSYAILLHDLGALYSSLCPGAPLSERLSALPDSFCDYSVARARASGSPEEIASEKFWKSRFESVPPSLELPTDRARPPLKTYSSLRLDYTLPGSVIQAAAKTGAKLGCSRVATLMAAFHALLYRLTAQEELVVGLPAAGQSAAGLNNLVGHCVNTLPIPSRIDGEMKTSDLLRTMKKTLLDAFDHQQFTYATLLKQLKVPRDPSRLPLVSVLFNVDQKLDAAKLGFPAGLGVEFFSNPRLYENFELFINAVDHQGKFILEVQYNTDLFDEATILRWMSCYETLLAGLAANPETPVSRLPLLSVAEQDKILLSWNATDADYPRELTVSQLFERQAAATPQSIAAVFGERTITYRELDQRSNRLARHLRAIGVRAGSLVGISLERSLEMLVAMLATLKAGAGYVPLDPAYPSDRIEYMLTHSGLKVLLTQASVLPDLPPTDARVVLMDAQTDDARAVASQSDEAMPQVATPENIAYVIYTSGSTGKPKGVMVPHRAVVNFLTSIRREPGLTAQDTWVAVTTLSFDIAVLELWLPICTGARTVIASRETAADGEALRKLLETSGATGMQATPATWRLLLAAGWKNDSPAGRGFKVLAGGEAVPRDLINTLLGRVDTVWNMYGPTETTVWSTCQPIRSKTGPVSIGRPLANTQVYLLDRNLQPVPVGVAAELHIGGAGVTLGYLHRADLTAERFIDNPYFNPFGADLNHKLYKTGDLVRHLADGSLEFVGRNDHQVKVRGYRIELGEIEAVLAQHPSVAQNVVVVREDQPGDVRLVAYVILRPGSALEMIEARKHLRASLPEYMVPQNLVVLEKFPQTNNGKIDRKALPAPHLVAGANATPEATDDYVAPRTPAEKILAELWQELLRVERVGIRDNFFDRGGHSLLSIQFLVHLEKRTGQRINPRLLLLNSLEQLALQLKISETTAPAKAESPAPQESGGWLGRLGIFNKANDAPAKDPGIQPRPKKDRAPVSFAQEQIWKVERLSPGATVYNLPSAFRLKGTLDVAALEAALNMIVARHEALRTTLREGKNGLEQIIAPELKFRLTVQPASESTILATLMSKAAQTFNLETGPLVRAELFKLSEREHALFFMPHHAVWDGWSFDLFLREMDTLYAAFAKDGDRNALKTLPFQYGDYTLWHRQSAQGLKRERDYWRAKLSGSLPQLELPTDRPRGSKLSLAGAMHEIHYSKDLADRLAALAKTEGVTLSGALFAAYQAFLMRKSGARDVIVGMPVQGRSAEGSRELMGCFINTLPVRVKLEGATSFREVLRQAQDATLEAFDHQEMPLSQLIDDLKIQAAPGRTPLFQASYSYQDGSQRRTRFADLELGQFHLHPGGVPTDLLLWFKVTPTVLGGAFEYRTDLFEAATIAAWATEFERLLELMIATPDRSVFELNASASAKSPAAATKVEAPAPRPATPAMSRAANPFFFESAGKRLLGIYHPVLRTTHDRDSAVLLCYPWGQEYLRAHWAFRQLANQMVKAGFPVLRFDYFGTGDAEGTSDEGTLSQWKTDIASAARELQSLSGTRRISVVGLRLGAALAALATREGKLAAQDLILWDPVVKGTSYLAELTDLHAQLLRREPFSQSPSAEEITAQGEIVGFGVPQALRAEIQAIDLAAPGAPWVAKRVSVVSSTESAEARALGFDYRHIPDGGEWGRIEEAHGSLLAPKVIQEIVAILAGRRS